MVKHWNHQFTILSTISAKKRSVVFLGGPLAARFVSKNNLHIWIMRVINEEHLRNCFRKRIWISDIAVLPILEAYCLEILRVSFHVHPPLVPGCNPTALHNH
jgi:hypothetical protein